LRILVRTKKEDNLDASNKAEREPTWRETVEILEKEIKRLRAILAAMEKDLAEAKTHVQP
jgi:hypothetical protein